MEDSAPNRRRRAAFRARLLAQGLTAIHAFLPRHLATTLATTATRHAVNQGVVLEAALAESLHHVRPSTIQYAAQQRKLRGIGLPRG